MSEAAPPQESLPESGDQGDETDIGYKAPAQKPFEDIIKADDEDESLRKYKESLLGGAAAAGKVVVFPDDPRHVIVRKLVLVSEGRPEIELDLTQKLEDIKKKVKSHNVTYRFNNWTLNFQKFTLKEGSKFKIRIEFFVQRDIVNGLKYVQKTSRMGIPVDKIKHMVGSYGPREEIHSFTTSTETAPAGMALRGSYSVHSLFTDDYGTEHLKVSLSLKIISLSFDLFFLP